MLLITIIKLLRVYIHTHILCVFIFLSTELQTAALSPWHASRWLKIDYIHQPEYISIQSKSLSARLAGPNPATLPNGATRNVSKVGRTVYFQTEGWNILSFCKPRGDFFSSTLAKLKRLMVFKTDILFFPLTISKLRHL